MPFSFWSLHKLHLMGKSSDDFQNLAANLPLLLSQTQKYLAVLRVCASGFVLCKAAHLVAVAPAQGHLHRLLLGRQAFGAVMLAGGQGVNTLEAGGMGLTLGKEVVKLGSLPSSQPPGQI